MFGFAGGATGNVVRVAIKGDSDLKKTLDQGEKDVKSFGQKISSSLKANAAEIKAGFALAAGAAVVSFVKSSTDAAVALGESQNAVQKVFGESTETIEAFGDVAASVAGLSKREFNELSTVTGSLLKNMGFNADEASVKTVQLTTRAADMASVFNTDVRTAMEAVNSAIKGEGNPIEQFGVKISAATVKAKALEMGLGDATGAIDDNAKATATLQLIMEQTANTAGDFAQTSDDLANAQRVAAARAENAAAKFGRAWTPVFADIVGFAGDALLSFQALGGSETAQMELRVSEAITGIQKAADGATDALTEMGKGKEKFGAIQEEAHVAENALTALAEGMLHVAENGELTQGIFRTLAAQAGLTDDQMDAFRETVLRQAEAMGHDAEMLAELEAAMASAEGPTGDLADTTEELARAERDQEAATEAARVAIEKKQSVLRGIHDPLFKLVKLNGDLADAEDAVAEAEKEGVASEEYREAVIDRAELLAELMDTMIDLREDGIDPTGEAASRMLEGLGIPDSVMADIFRMFDEMERNFESREFIMNISGQLPNDPTGAGATSTGVITPGGQTVQHTGGVVNAPRGQEVMGRLLGGEMVVNPDNDRGMMGGGGSVVMYNTFQISEATAGREVMRKIREELERMESERI